ncbi:sulfite oxidase-like oxidoreductase [Symmachiella macrocystis]|nr:sulfite oxidase-like oxidoreductase [Symmachiella macrocystis]
MSEAEKYQTGDAPGPHTHAEEVIISSDTHRENRVPPGQTRTRKWPVLHYGRVPHVELDTWELTIDGLVDQPLKFSWSEFGELPRAQVFSDFHCVTTWSRLGNLWDGVAVRELLERAGVQSAARYVVAHGYDDGWTTNMPLADFLSPDAIFADRHDGQPLSADHGGPLRLVVPLLYAWKSAKWLKRIELVAEDRPGLWEQAGYHNHGDPWTEERFGG